MDKLDLTQPLEAVHRDTGAVVLVSLGGEANDRGFLVTPDLRGGWCHFRLDGSHLCNACPWSIRNLGPTVKLSTPSNEELTQRMEIAPETLQGLIDLVHEVVAFFPGAYRNEHPVYVARALQLDLPKPVDPIDPDLIEARECVAEVYQGANLKAQAEAARAGLQDDRLRVRIARLAIARGRTLAAGGTAHE